ncbi:unnamed protein product [Closterium sp. NIES-53]
MLALCREHRPEHRTKHIALRYFLARELQQRGQLRLAYVASQANTGDVFTKALQPCDHQPCFVFLDWSCDLLFSPTLPMGFNHSFVYYSHKGAEVLGATRAPGTDAGGSATPPAGADADGSPRGAREPGDIGAADGTAAGAVGPASAPTRGAAGARGGVFSEAAVTGLGAGGRGGSVAMVALLGPAGGLGTTADQAAASPGDGSDAPAITIPRVGKPWGEERNRERKGRRTREWYQAAARRALNTMEESSDEDERDDPSYREEALSESENEETEGDGMAREGPRRREEVVQQTDLQYGVAVPGGAEAEIHAARAFSDARPESLVLQADISNAFNSISRATIADALHEPTPSPLLPLVKLTYGNPSQLLLDSNFNSAPLTSERGERQGDPLGPLLFAAGIHTTLRETAEAHPGMLCLANADDVTFLGDTARTVAAFTYFTAKLAHLGLEHNPQKCAAWSSSAIDAACLPPGVPFTKDGVRLLGSFVGPDSGAAQFLAGQLAEMSKPLHLLERADPQVAALLLTRCISRRVAYLTRTTPLHLLPRDRWSHWGRDLLATLLTLCDIRFPTCRTEQLRVWEQASLPPSLGGLGIMDPLVEGIYGFAASFTQAALYLSCLPLEEDNALTLARNHMLLPRVDNTPLHTWLTECEEALPLDAQEILEKERLERSDIRLQHVLGLKVHGSRYAKQVQATRRMKPNPLGGHMHRMFSLIGYGTGDWLTAIPVAPARRIGPVHFANAVRFRLGLPFSTPKNSLGTQKHRRARGWAAREHADKKIKHYANRPETVGFFPLAVDTYGCPSAEVPVFLKLLADTAARRHSNADSKSYYAAQFLHQFRQRWSVALQRAQSVGLLLKLGEAAAAENPPVGGIGEELHLGDCFAVVEPFLEL